MNVRDILCRAWILSVVTLGCSNVLGLDGFEDAAGDGGSTSAGATSATSGGGGSSSSTNGTGGASTTVGSGGGSSVSTSTAGGGGAGGSLASACADAVAAGQYNACVDATGTFYWGLSTIYASGAPIPDAQVAAGEWLVSLWALGDPLNGTQLVMSLESPGVARVDLSTSLPEGLCPYHLGAQRHPLRLGSPERAGVYGFVGDASNKQPGLFDSLPDQTGGNWGATFAIAKDNEGIYPAASLASADMMGAQAECSP